MSRKVRIRAELTAKQAAFLHDPAPFRAFVGGVGSGKTFAGSLEALRQPAGSIGMVVAPTYPMLKDASLKTFLQNAGPAIESLNKADLHVKLVDGSEVLFRSADNPDRLRGPNLGWFWLDEGALMTAETWDIMLGRLRLKPGRGWVTSTPRGRNWLYESFGRDREGYALFRASTRENRYLPDAFVASLEAKYTSQFRLQEVEGEFVSFEGALWTWDMIDAQRVSEPPAMRRVVVGVDPAGGGPDEIGLVVVGEGVDRHGYVLEDASMRGSPAAWAQAVVALVERHGADRVVAEKNFGGDMVEHTLRTAAPHMPVKVVSASRGKHQRAEPVAALYEQKRVHHVGSFMRLEEQMTTWDPNDTKAASPDRVDALVWALTELMIQQGATPFAFSV